MLPDRLLSFDRGHDGRVLPRWLGPRDEVWLRELAAEADAAIGSTLSEAERRILEKGREKIAAKVAAN